MATPSSRPSDGSSDPAGMPLPKKSSSASKGPSFTPDPSWTVISQGAEARIWKIPAFLVEPSVDVRNSNGSSDGADHPIRIAAVAKERFRKSYRHPKLDERLTTQRCRAEARILAKCYQRKVIRVPRVVQVDPPVLYMEFLPYGTLRQFIDAEFTTNPTICDTLTDSSSPVRQPTAVVELAKLIGSEISKLHHAMGLIHGDLTTSNILVDKAPLPSFKDPEESISSEAAAALQLVFIDFGLAKSTESAEERAVDLYVLERALTSTHPQLPDDFLTHVLAAYLETAAAAATATATTGLSTESSSASTNRSAKYTKAAQATLTRLEQVRQRGRKRECFG